MFPTEPPSAAGADVVAVIVGDLFFPGVIERSGEEKIELRRILDIVWVLYCVAKFMHKITVHMIYFLPCVISI